MSFDKYLQRYSSIQKESLIPLLDRVKRAKNNYEPVFTNFLSPEEQIILRDVCFSEGLLLNLCGGKGEFERALGVISSYEFYGEFPLSVVKITGNFKFEKLNHRDYLGSVLALGIKREKIGDINVFDDGAEIILSSDIADYVLNNLEKIKHTSIKRAIIDINDSREKIQEYKEKRVNVASLRLDSVVGAAINMSRSKAVDIIRGGDVKLNHFPMQESAHKVNPNDIISVKGFGRYKIDEITGLTKKDRITIIIKQYV